MDLELAQRLDRIERLLATQKKVLNFDEVCDYTGISKSYLYKLTSHNKIPFSKPNGKVIFFEKEELDKWLLLNRQKTIKEIEDEASNYMFQNRKF
ncbi:helix-turn-helix domain-containing protein [Maribacter sp. M208]|uniref:helix-turn-helix transcriptional regulator n=1 Tax=Maribacter huludaoensis TaxID=3030010 RepID=UPI0023ED6DEE|nr:helix-turn-helix domain-containing protein [Maribacter huludaoensis]MDF4221074.1 helix-turn-helix domain-containing protein [Maribacter huludaoensis]